MKNKKAQFFCENCGAKVPENAKLCKNCGKFFISVRCPSCGVIGNAKDFEKGCPHCGYAKGADNKTSVLQPQVKEKKRLFKIRPFAFALKQDTGRETSLPMWIYALTTAGLFGVLWGVYSCIRNPF